MAGIPHSLAACPLSPAAFAVTAAERDAEGAASTERGGTIVAASPAAARILAGLPVYGPLPPHAMQRFPPKSSQSSNQSHFLNSSHLPPAAAHARPLPSIDITDRMLPPIASPSLPPPLALVGRRFADLFAKPKNLHNSIHSPIPHGGVVHTLLLAGDALDATPRLITACRHCATTNFIGIPIPTSTSSSKIKNESTNETTKSNSSASPAYDVWFLEEVDGLAAAHAALACGTSSDSPSSSIAPQTTIIDTPTSLSLRISAFGRVVQVFPLAAFAGAPAAACLGRFIMALVDDRDLPVLLRALADAWKSGAARAVVRWSPPSPPSTRSHSPSSDLPPEISQSIQPTPVSYNNPVATQSITVNDNSTVSHAESKPNREETPISDIDSVVISSSNDTSSSSINIASTDFIHHPASWDYNYINPHIRDLHRVADDADVMRIADQNHVNSTSDGQSIMNHDEPAPQLSSTQTNINNTDDNRDDNSVGNPVDNQIDNHDDVAPNWVLLNIYLCPPLPPSPTSMSAPIYPDNLLAVVEDATLICFARELSDNQHSPDAESDSHHNEPNLPSPPPCPAAVSDTTTTTNTFPLDTKQKTRTPSLAHTSMSSVTTLVPPPSTSITTLDHDLPETPSALIIDIVQSYVLSPVCRHIQSWTGIDPRCILGMFTLHLGHSFSDRDDVYNAITAASINNDDKDNVDGDVVQSTFSIQTPHIITTPPQLPLSPLPPPPPEPTQQTVTTNQPTRTSGLIAVRIGGALTRSEITSTVPRFPDPVSPFPTRRHHDKIPLSQIDQ